MNFARVILLCSVYALCDAANISSTESNIIAGYVPGLSGMPPINEIYCQNIEILNDPTLSNALECARTCHAGDPPKTCYYSFTVERYPVYGGACEHCIPDVSNSICANCQCVTLDGVERMALTVNRMMPGPSIQVCLGDYIVVDVQNNIKEDAITIHWHGLYQTGSQYYDGPPFITQCPIDPGNVFRYQFYGGNSGTHFWHSHSGLQKMDGLAGSLIIREPAQQDPNSHLYDYDLSNHIIFLSDWMHEETTSRHPGRQHGILGQLPDAVFINGKGTQTAITNPTGNIATPSSEVFTVDANKRYRFRMINSFCGICPAELTIQNHNYTLIATDGLPVKPVKITSIISYPGERFDFVITTNATPGAYWVQLRALGLCELYNIQQLAILQYLGAPAIPDTLPPTESNPLPEGIVLQPIDSNCDGSNPNELCISNLESAIPNDRNVSGEPDERFYVSAGVYHYTPQELWQPNTYNEFSVPLTDIMMIDTVNNISFQTPASPLISQFYDTPPGEFCNAENMPPWNNTIPISCIHLRKIKKDALVEVALIDGFHKPTMQHPFHLHGHSFRVTSMGQPLGPSGHSIGDMSVEYFLYLVANHEIKMNVNTPPGKDTLTMPNNGYAIYRFYANNAGFWLNHCHILVHQVDGMQLVVQVGELSDLPPVPPNFPKCGDFKPKIQTSNISNTQ
ncbi:uncharacterized protein LOC143372965 [Andrena cerasifolii]|uniref:uncharacterized protein LOC143372965 n=1 Tax=Andrena cerasifolii TaxID=2819439 RepID=UPI0040377BB6